MTEYVDYEYDDDGNITAGYVDHDRIADLSALLDANRCSQDTRYNMLTGNEIGAIRRAIDILDR